MHASQDDPISRFKWASGLCVLVILLLLLTPIAFTWPAQQDWWTFLPDVAILVYAASAFRKGGGKSRLLNRYAESAYFLGYFATTLGLLMMAIKSPFVKQLADGGKINLIDFLVKGGGCVSCSVVGLACMFLLRLHVHGQEFEEEEANRDLPGVPFGAPGAGSAILEAKAQEISRRIDALFTALEKRQSEAWTKTTDNIYNSVQTCRDLQFQIQKSTEAIRDSTEAFSQTLVEKTRHMSEAFSTVLNGFQQQQVTALKALFDAIAGFDGRLREMDSSMRQLPAQFAGLSSAMAEMRTVLGQATADTRVLGESVARLDSPVSSLARYSAEIENHLASTLRLGTDLAKFSEMMVQTTAATEACQRQLTALGEDCAAAQAAMIGGLEKLMQHSDLLGAVTRDVGQIASTAGNVAPSLAGMTANLSRLAATTNEVETICHHFLETSRSASESVSSAQAMSRQVNELAQTSAQAMQAMHDRMDQLNQLAQPMGDFARNLKQMNPDLTAMGDQLKALGQVAAQLDAFTGQAAAMKDVITKLQAGAVESARAMEHFEKRLISFAQSAVAAEHARRKTALRE